MVEIISQISGNIVDVVKKRSIQGLLKLGMEEYQELLRSIQTIQRILFLDLLIPMFMLRAVCLPHRSLQGWP